MPGLLGRGPGLVDGLRGFGRTRAAKLPCRPGGFCAIIMVAAQQLLGLDTCRIRAIKRPGSARLGQVRVMHTGHSCVSGLCVRGPGMPAYRCAGWAADHAQLAAAAAATPTDWVRNDRRKSVPRASPCNEDRPPRA